MSRVRKLICWLFIDLIVAAVIIGLLAHRPGSYNPTESASAGLEPGQVSPYLTHELSPRIYNGAQRGKPFDVVVAQKGINEIVASWGWPKMSQGVMLHSPLVLFRTGSVLLMGTADVKGAEFVITIKIEPEIDAQGLLNLQVTKFLVGAMNVTPLAKMTANRMYAQKAAEMPMDRGSFQTKIVQSLLNGVPFEPVFEVDDRKMRIKAIAIGDEKLVARLIPDS
ncbi:MAG: hypothetical protein JSW59_13930 [Phycisphaerales bacterium]|nr:MAG: hypothetical protein JSW59_13930 [Phycisphaerales bacterium]